MASTASTRAEPGSARDASLAVMPVLLCISFVHMMNDSMQAVVPAMFTVLEKSLSLSFAQVGWITFALNMTSSVMQPVVGSYTDKTARPYLLPLGMCLSLIGMVGIAFAPAFWSVLIAVMFIGLGSSIFHPEGSRVVYFAAGGKRGLAQSIYQVGGNAGSSLAPLMAAAIFIPFGQHGAIWGTLFAAFAIAALMWLIPWYKGQLNAWREKSAAASAKRKAGAAAAELTNHPRALFAMTLLVFIVFGRSWYHSGISGFYQFYLIDHYGLSKSSAQIPLFLFLATGVAGTFFGGVMADRIGLKKMIVLSIVGALPFSLALPYLPLWAIYPAIAIMGFILLSGFSVAVVYAQHLLPTKVGMASGLTTGLAFGMGAIGAVVLGKAADVFGMSEVMHTIGILPVVGFLAMLLPSDRKRTA
ncbi:MFS transporter [Cohnella hashimotonis]|uniref:MFS transporter n=1 Tax=Cohnella hashimotonis TaxID=2826895 RepID=A0ABT6TRA7_9BACL|nr:MFS transporter [Cohnella hashimotonis]MDI4648327.1 MFS transporter [Cohnella hashimotonis]